MMFALATLAAFLQACAPSVAPDTMRAIVSVESRGYIYAINDNTTHAVYCVPGAPIFPCSRDRAVALVERAVRSGHSVDVGVAQVNSGNFGTYGVSETQMLDPCENLRTGGKILASAYRQSMSRFTDERTALWHAVMAYNTGSLYAGEHYVQAVVAAARGRATLEVPSIAILRGSGPGTRRLVAVAEQGGRAVSLPRMGRLPNPRLAPLLAQGLNSSPRGIFHETLMPAVSH